MFSLNPYRSPDGPPEMTANELLAMNDRNIYYDHLGLRNHGSLGYGVILEQEELDPIQRIFSGGSVPMGAPYRPNTVSPSIPTPTPIITYNPYTEETFGPRDTSPPQPVDLVPHIPSQEEARGIVQDFYLRYLNRQPDDAGWTFWSDSFINNIKGNGLSFSTALSELRNAFLQSGEYVASNPTDINGDNPPATLADLFNNLFKSNTNASTGGGKGGFTVVPQEVASESSGSNSILIILAVVGIIATFGIHYYFKHHG